MLAHIKLLTVFFFNDTATTEIYTLSPTRRSSDLSEGAVQRCPEELPQHDFEFYQAVATANLHTYAGLPWRRLGRTQRDRKSTRLNSSHSQISYAVFCLKKKYTIDAQPRFNLMSRS